MVTKEELKQFETQVKSESKTSYKVTASELSHFTDSTVALSKLIGDRKKQYEKENQVSSGEAYFDIEEMCKISVDVLRKSISHTRKITRKFLYKFTLGFQMSLDEANKYFELCGGPLNPLLMEDYICIKALEDKDDIEQFISDMKKHANINL